MVQGHFNTSDLLNTSFINHLPTLSFISENTEVYEKATLLELQKHDPYDIQFDEHLSSAIDITPGVKNPLFEYIDKELVITEKGNDVLQYYKNSTKKKFKVLEFGEKHLTSCGYDFTDIKEFMNVLAQKGEIIIKKLDPSFIFSFKNK